MERPQDRKRIVKTGTHESLKISRRRTPACGRRVYTLYLCFRESPRPTSVMSLERRLSTWSKPYRFSLNLWWGFLVFYLTHCSSKPTEMKLLSYLALNRDFVQVKGCPKLQHPLVPGSTQMVPTELVLFFFQYVLVLTENLLLANKNKTKRKRGETHRYHFLFFCDTDTTKVIIQSENFSEQ